MENILITGVNGFIGSALAARLLSQGKRIVGLVRDRNYKTRRDILDRISVAYGDLSDIRAVRYAVSKYEVDTIFHLGAIAVLRMGIIDPVTCWETNVMGTVNVLEAARAAKHVRKVVVASSDKAYGTHTNLPYIESMALLPSDPYGTSKACTDLIARSYADTYGMDISVVRSGNVFGPGDLNRSRLIPGSILKLLEGKPPVIYKLVGAYRREFMFIEDVIDAYIKIADFGLPGEPYNIGGSGFQTIIKTIEMIIEEMGSNLVPEIVEKEFVEIKEQYLDASKLMRLGWSCRYPIRDGIREAVAWYREYAKEPTKYFYAA